MLAEAIEITMKKGIRIINHDVGGLNDARQSKAKGTGTKVAMVIRALDVNSLWEVIGNVLVYSIPLPSEVKSAEGLKDQKTHP